MHETLSPLIAASLSPVFLLSAIGLTMSLIDTRHNRIVQHVRDLEQEAARHPAEAAHWEEEIARALRRAGRIGRAAVLCIVAALLVAVVVVMLLVDAQTEVSLTMIVEAAFTGGVLSYGLSLALFLRDVLEVNRDMARAERRAARILAAARRGPD
jgi:hypothetical protein